MSRPEVQAEALARATQSDAMSNLPAIFAEFAARGITDVQPRVNVFTFNAWRALGRTVRRGEHGVRITTWVPMTRRNESTGERISTGKRPKAAYVFHVSQTDAIAGASPSHSVATFAAGAL